MMTIGGQNTALSRDSTTVSEVIEKLLSIAESNAAATEEMAASIEETRRTVSGISLKADNLQALVSHFKV